MKYTGLDRFFDPYVVRGEWGYRAEFKCVEGHTFEEPGYHRTHRATLWEPEEGNCYCPECGSSDYGKNDEPRVFKAFRRRVLPRAKAA